jgi:hypothetical protein
VLLMPEGFKFPFALVRRPQGWRVKATSLIAARRDPLSTSEDAPASESKSQAAPTP